MSTEGVHATLINPNYVDGGLPTLALGKVACHCLKT